MNCINWTISHTYRVSHTDCSVCSDGYTHALGPSCSKCSDATGFGVALVAVFGVAIFAGFVVFLTYILSGQEQDADRGIVVRLARYIPLNSLKIVIVVWQILTQVGLPRSTNIIDQPPCYPSCKPDEVGH